MPEGLVHISLDLLDTEECAVKLQALSDVTHVFCCAWMNKGKEEENCKAMKTLVSSF